MRYSATGERVVRKRLADGTVKEYRYGPRPKSHRFADDSLGALILAYKRSPEWLGLADATRATYSVYLKVLEAVPHTPVANITRRQILEIRDAIATKRGVGASTGFLRTASALFGWALDREWIAHSPMHRVRPIPGGSLPTWTRQQAHAAIKGLPHHLYRVVFLAWHTGQRRTDLARLRWSDYDGQTIRLVQQKTGQPLALPASAELRAELDEWKRAATSVTILADAKGKPWDATYLSSALGRAMAKLGMPGLNVHGLRKLRATELADSGATTHEIAAITGHRTLSMVAHYTRSADQERLANAAANRLSKPRQKRR
jgi:integrase